MSDHPGCGFGHWHVLPTKSKPYAPPPTIEECHREILRMRMDMAKAATLIVDSEPENSEVMAANLLCASLTGGGRLTHESLRRWLDLRNENERLATEATVVYSQVVVGAKRWWQRTPTQRTTWYVRHRVSGGVIGPFPTAQEAEVRARYMTSVDGLPEPKPEMQRLFENFPVPGFYPGVFDPANIRSNSDGRQRRMRS